MMSADLCRGVPGFPLGGLGRLREALIQGKYSPQASQKRISHCSYEPQKAWGWGGADQARPVS